MAMQSLLTLYLDKRMAKVLFLGFVSGFPWLLIATMLNLWLKEEGISRTDIALFSLLFSVYAVNALWAPFVDKFNWSVLGRWLGRRRAWIVLMQVVIGLALIALFFLPDVKNYIQWVAVLMFIIAIASATQDVAIDATRIELFAEAEPEKVGAGSAMATTGWWLGFGGGKIIALPFVELLQQWQLGNAWQLGYLAMSFIIVLSITVFLFAFTPPTKPATDPPPATPAVPSSPRGRESTVLPSTLPLYAKQLYLEPLKAFFYKFTLKPALLLLFFIVFFKIGEAFLGRMSVIFYKEIGFSKTDIALLSGGLGTVTICVFAIFGSLFNARYGLFKGIVLGGVGMALTNLLFALLAYYPEKSLFAVAVVADQFTTAVSTVAFVAFISQLCDRRFTATHYAALASLGNLSRTLFAAGSGWMVDSLENLTGADANSGYADAWALFFAITVIMVLPSLVALFFLRHRLTPLMSGTTALLSAK